VLLIKEIGEGIGLSLNTCKCELVCNPSTDKVDSLLQSFTRRNIDDDSLLGAQFVIASMELDRVWSARLAELDRAVDRLSLLDAQEALVLLRASFCAPRVQHLLRCSPSVKQETLDTFYSILKSAVCKIPNCSLPDNKWIK